MKKTTGWFWAMIVGAVLWVLLFLAVDAAMASERCRPAIEQSDDVQLVDAPRYAAMAGIQMDLNVNSLQVGAALTQDGQAAGFGKRFCLSADKCGFFGFNAGFDDHGESYTVSTTWVLR